MANPFLEGGHEEIETAIMLENARQCDLGELNRDHANAVAFTDGKRVFINTDDNLSRILPNYNKGMLKWLLWHERMHMELKHHNRFFKYLSELNDRECRDEFQVTKNEVNIIMDILVHDWMSKKFPELVETAVNNFAQMRTRNSLKFTFTTYTLEEMLDEYKKHKKGEDKPEEGKGTPDGKSGKKTEDKEKGKDKPKDDSTTTKGEKKTHGEGGDGGKTDTKEKDEIKETPEPASEHDKTDWSKLKDIDDKEFITEDEGDYLMNKVEDLKHKKIKLGRLTQALNGLATTARTRTYKVPSYIHSDEHIILKGKQPGRAALYLVFDASGSMGRELETFKEIISKSIPQAMEVPCDWFAGHHARIVPDHHDGGQPYYKGKFRDIMPVYADNGYSDDGDRTIALCLEAEKKGYSPIGVTDGGGGIYDVTKVKQLKRTILVGDNESWLQKAKQLNPNIQTLCI